MYLVVIKGSGEEMRDSKDAVPMDSQLPALLVFKYYTVVGYFA